MCSRRYIYLYILYTYDTIKCHELCGERKMLACLRKQPILPSIKLLIFFFFSQPNGHTCLSVWGQIKFRYPECYLKSIRLANEVASPFKNKHKTDKKKKHNTKIISFSLYYVRVDCAVNKNDRDNIDPYSSFTTNSIH